MEQMQIEILGTGNMVQTGKSILRSFQNNHTPVLDLFVREVLQNCCDAYQEGNKFVKVDFITGKFDRKELSDCLEDFNTRKVTAFPHPHHKFLAVRDYNTTGLTGKTNKADVNDGDYGNFIKLVYDLGKPQGNEGRGGSWGYGKTIYYRLSIVGLTIYYSRIKNADNRYESRLAACLIEDETKPKTMLQGLNGSSKSGVAWWGEKISENKTVPITDEKFITEFLEIFGLEEYKGSETGTTVIIPFLNDNILASVAESSNDGQVVYWSTSIEQSLELLAQRWYFPRLNNRDYAYGSYLQVFINGQRLIKSNTQTVFQIWQSLYNRAANGFIDANHLPKDYSDYISDNHINCGVEEIKIANKFKNSTVGRIAYAKLSRRELHMEGNGFNDYSPFIYVDREIIDNEHNSPLLCFCRKPGMIVSYETEGDWLRGVPPTNPKEYILSMFVLNSDNEFRNGLKLEEYFRLSEEADHASWDDHDGYNTAKAIRLRIRNKLKEIYGQSKTDEEVKQDSGLGQWVGELILPPQGFGTSSKGQSGSKSGGSDGPTKRLKTLTTQFLKSETRYFEDGIKLYYKLKTSEKCVGFDVELNVSTENTAISLEAWETEMGLSVPFEISSVELLIEKEDKKTSKELLKVDQESMSINNGCINAGLDWTTHASCNKYFVQMNEGHEREIKLCITLNVVSKEKTPSISFR